MSAPLVLRFFQPDPAVMVAGCDRDALARAHVAGSSFLVLIGPPGRQGDPGDTTIVRTAGEPIGGHRAVRVDAVGLAWLADKDDADPDASIGVSTGAASIGAPVTIQMSAEISESGWSWAAGAVWLGTGGQLTQSPPTTGALVRIGTATRATSLKIEPRLIARLI